MPALSPQFLFDFESEMSAITELEFGRLVLAENQWWREVTKVRQTGKEKEIIAWLLSTAQIRDQGLGGNIHYDDMAATFTEFDVKNSGAALELTRDQVEDNDGNGFDFAAEWSQQVGAKMAYFPQSKVASLILNGAATDGTANAYDGKPFFTPIGNPHPVNQFRTSAGSYANQFTGAAAGSYPGAVPIDESVTLDVALLNIAKVVSYVGNIKMPDGVTPRYLKPRRLIVAPRLVPRAQMLTNSRVLPFPVSGTGGGSADVAPIISNWGFAQPIEAQEFGGLSDTQDKTWYLACEQVTTTQLGAFVYVDREPFHINYYTGQGGGTGVDAILGRQRVLEWQLLGRNASGYGNPYTIFMCSPV